MKKPKILLTTASYRIVQTQFYNYIETADGRDRMGQQRWRDLTAEERATAIERVVDHIGDALVLREKRRRAARGGAS